MSTTQDTSEVIRNYDKAVGQLSMFVVKRAKEQANRLGFGWVATSDAPSTYDMLKLEHELSVSNGRPMPVSSLYCDTVIYTRPSVNYAMRFWHDTLHIETGLTFRLDDELELGLHHLAIAERQGIKKGSAVWDMLRIDILGQNYLLGIANRFPIDQAEFVKGCMLYGLDEGVLREARKEAV